MDSERQCADPGTEKSEGRSRGICIQRVLAKWYCGCSTILLDIELRNVQKAHGSWRRIHIFGFEEGRSVTEIATAIRLLAAAGVEWGTDFGLCGLDGCVAGV